MTELETDDVSVPNARFALQLATTRMKALANSEEAADGRMAISEIGNTVLPFLSDLLVLVDRLEEHAEWATKKLDGEIEESQLLPEDADRIQAFVQIVIDLAKDSIQSLDPTSTTAIGFKKLMDEGAELLEFVDDIRVDDDDDDEPDEGDGDDAPDDPDINTNAPRGEA